MRYIRNGFLIHPIIHEWNQGDRQSPLQGVGLIQTLPVRNRANTQVRP
ncbi:hypothetical protein [Xanthocytophaga flava]|nr:hypothetical protein [Xanthocytophaga flavus]MDJ1473372.1 hypothetical protein [Xanthocytophaga flavus]